MDRTTASILQGLVRKEGRSLLQYVSESFPWTTARDREVLATLQDMAKEEQQATAALVGFLVKSRVSPPYLGAYPMSFTTINYMSLGFLLPYLIDFESRRVAELKHDLALVSSQEDAHSVLKGLLEIKERHLATLISLAQREKPAA
jgi:hypothetical protein